MDNIAWVVWSAVAATMLAWGGFTAWLADQKERDPLGWFALGLLFGPIALLAVGLAPTLGEVDRAVLRGETLYQDDED